MDRPISNAKQVKLYRKTIIKTFTSIGLFFALCFLIYWILTPSMSRDNIRTALVERGELIGSFNASGVVLPLSEEIISSEINSRLVKVMVKVGAYVEKGDPILQLDTQQQALKIESIIEKIALKDSQIETAALRREQSSNDIKSRRQLLEVDLESRQARVDRLSQLSSIGASSAQDLLEAKLNVKRTHIELSQLTQALDDIQKTSESEQASLRLEKSILEKELKEEKRLMNASLVVASRSGLVSWLKEEEGSSVSLGEPLAKISDSKAFRIEATLSDFYAQQLTAGMDAIVHIKDERLPGRLATLTPRFENGVMKVSINLDDANSPVLRNNMRVEVSLVTHVIDNAIRIAKGPFVNSSGIQDVFVLRDGVAHKQQVTLGISNKDFYQIEKGLAVGDEVIISDVSEMKHLNQFSIH